jgi:hypothetical protein
MLQIRQDLKPGPHEVYILLGLRGGDNRGLWSKRNLGPLGAGRGRGDKL